MNRDDICPLCVLASTTIDAMSSNAVDAMLADQTKYCLLHVARALALRGRRLAGREMLRELTRD